MDCDSDWLCMPKTEDHVLFLCVKGCVNPISFISVLNVAALCFASVALFAVTACCVLPTHLFSLFEYCVVRHEKEGRKTRSVVKLHCDLITSLDLVKEPLMIPVECQNNFLWQMFLALVAGSNVSIHQECLWTPPHPPSTLLPARSPLPPVQNVFNCQLCLFEAFTHLMFERKWGSASCCALLVHI